jgi:flagellar biosynthesis component FlhA
VSFIILSTDRQIKQIIIRVRVSNEVILDFIQLFVILINVLILFINFGFNIKELISSFPSALPAVTLSRS